METSPVAVSMMPTDPNASVVSPGFDYRQFVHYLLEKSWVVVLCLLAGTFLAVGYLYRTPPLYQSRSVLEVDVQAQRIAPVEGIETMNFQSQEQLRTIEQNLRTRSLMERVVLANDLGNNPAFLPLPENGQPYSPESLANVLLRMVNPAVRRGTRLIDVSVTHTDPKMAQLLADSIGKEYIRQSIEKRAGTARLAYDFLREEADRLKKKLTASENRLQAYREEKGSASFNDRENIVATKLQDLNSKETQAKTERMRLESDFSALDKFKNDPDQLLTVPSIANHPTVVEIKNQITAMNGNIANLAQRYKEKHPRMIQARSQLAELKRSMREAVLRLPPLIKTEYGNAVETENNIQAALSEQEKTALDLNKQSIPFNELQREVDADKALYESVLKRGNETDLTKGVQSDPVQIQESASFSPVPVSPQPLRTMLEGIFGGLAVGVLIVGLLNFLDRSIKTVDQAEQVSGLPVLAAVPLMKFPAEKSYMLMVRDPNSTAAEAFRSLRASVSLLGPESERKVLLFTSAAPSEGKSFSCTNYSVSLAQQGYRTLLIDADLRRPSIHKIFHFDRKIMGITDYLVGRADIQEASHAVEVPNLHVMPGGQKAPNPAELLSGESFAALVSDAARSYDRVVIDSAPVMAVSDTLLMTPYVQSVCLVVHARRTARNMVQRAVGVLEQVGSRPVGLVLNRLPRKSGINHYYYYTQHGYGDGVYGEAQAAAGASKT